MLTARPSFFLVPEGPNLDSVFPQTVVSGSEANTSQSSGQYTWILDFTEEGKHPGVIMSQSRMRDIELVVNPLSAINHMDTTGMISFGGRSWVDLLVRFITQEMRCILTFSHIAESYEHCDGRTLYRNICMLTLHCPATGSHWYLIGQSILQILCTRPYDWV